MHEEINRPIFVVGSPRSGTSILAWCLGHHPNIFPVPESNWMGEFAAHIGVAHQIGSARGDLSVLSAMDIRDDQFFAAFGRSINELIVGHRRQLEINRENSNNPSKANPRWLEATSMSAGPKTRWVDGTPEYSFHIFGLRKLFPEARFVHVLRDVGEVVRSMLNFHRVGGTHLVADEEDAYRYWIRTVSACFLAERAYGCNVVRRIRYADLIKEPKSTMRSLFNFVDEAYSERCLEPLQVRINSSTVPAECEASDNTVNPVTVEQAMQLSALVEKDVPVLEGSSAAVDEMEAVFRERVSYVATIDRAYQSAQQLIETLKKSGGANASATVLSHP